MHIEKPGRAVALTTLIAFAVVGCTSDETRHPPPDPIGPLASICIVTGANGVCRVVERDGERSSPRKSSGERVIVERGRVREGSVAGSRSVRVRVGDVVIVDGGSDNRVEVRLGTVD